MAAGGPSRAGCLAGPLALRPLQTRNNISNDLYLWPAKFELELELEWTGELGRGKIGGERRGPLLSKVARAHWQAHAHPAVAASAPRLWLDGCELSWVGLG